MGTGRKRGGSGKTVFLIISSVLMLTAVTAAFVAWAIPAYAIPYDQLHFVLIRLLPLLIGLTMIQIGLVAAHPASNPGKHDASDALPKSKFDKPLYTLPDHDPVQYPSPLATQSVADQRTIVLPSAIVAAQSSVLQRPEVPEHPLVSANRIATPFKAPPKVEQFPSVESKRIPVSVDGISRELKQDHDVGSRLDRAVLFAQYPYPIDPESDIAELLQPLPATHSVPGEMPAALLATIEDTLEDRSKIEISSAIQSGYDISVAIVSISDSFGMHKTGPLRQFVLERFSVHGYCYSESETLFAVILPFHSYSETKQLLAIVLTDACGLFPEGIVSAGFSSLGRNRHGQADILEEAHLALTVSVEQKGYSIIGFEDRPLSAQSS